MGLKYRLDRDDLDGLDNASHGAEDFDYIGHVIAFEKGPSVHFRE
jgi:hypothetical protein